MSDDCVCYFCAAIEDYIVVFLHSSDDVLSLIASECKMFGTNGNVSLYRDDGRLFDKMFGFDIVVYRNTFLSISYSVDQSF